MMCLAACAPRETPVIQGDPVATDALLALPQDQFFAQVSIARDISRSCPQIGFNEEFFGLLTQKKFGVAQSSATAFSPLADLEIDVAIRSLQARYDADFGSENLCRIGFGEITRQAPLSAVLVPI